ncbi:MAG: hypothetical protein VKL39_14085 [Leptolyngbyaceae bacterium]|nr:hypothetical protein [Leptolyngbyaceae bacterium]
MALQLSTTVRNAMADAFESSINTAGDAVLTIRTGAVPANCAAANSGTLLATIDVPADWLGAASNGAKALAGSWTTTAAATGTAAHFRIMVGATCHAQGTVTATGGGGDLTLNTTSISAVGQQVTVTTFTLTMTGA